LGCDVWFVEQVDAGRADLDACIVYFDAVFGADERAALVNEGGTVLAGAVDLDLESAAVDADLLVNVTGMLTVQPAFGRFARKAYLDEDPGYTQLWLASGARGLRLRGHDVYLTVGANIGRPGCSLPTAGIDWRPVRPPVVLDDWPVTRADGELRFTTVASWRGAFGAVEHDGRRYGQKAHEFRKLVALPRRARGRFELALDIDAADAADREALEENDWELVDPRRVAGTPDAFRSYVQGSGAEFSVAQGIYVETKGGWFSERTTRYLASGKPALVEDTGFAPALAPGEGVVPFRTLDEAVRGAADVEARYDEHCAAARAIAEAHFDSDNVLTHLLSETGLA
jgi:hypothetical protein